MENELVCLDTSLLIDYFRKTNKANSHLFKLTQNYSHFAVSIYRSLKKKNQLIDIPDLLIGATAIAHSLKLATLDEKHFSRIEGIELISVNTM